MFEDVPVFLCEISPGNLIRQQHLEHTPTSVYPDIVRHSAREIGLTDAVTGFGMHPLRATAATYVLAHDSDIVEV